MGKRYKHKRRKATSGDWERLTEDAILRSAYLQFAKSVKSAQETAVIRASSSGLPAQHFIDLREAGRILDQHPQLVNYLASIRERQEAQELARTIPLDTKSSPTGMPSQAQSLGGWSGQHDKNQPQGVPNARLLRDWSEQSEWVNATINYYCDRVSRADVAILPIDERTPYNRAIEKSVQLLLDQPNELGDTWPSLVKMGIRDFMTLGRFMWSKNMSAKREPTALYAEDAATVKVYPAWAGDPEQPRFLFDPDGTGRTKIPIRNDEMIYIPDGLSTYRLSFSRVQALRNTILSDLKATESASRVVDMKPPPHIIQIPGASNEQITRLRSTYNSDIQGRQEVMFLGGPNPAQVKAMVYSLKDNQWMEWMEYLARKICAIFQVSPQDIGLTFDINKATAGSQQDISENKGLIPLLLLVEEYMNRHLLADFAPRMKNGRTNINALNLRIIFPEVSETSRVMHIEKVINTATKSMAGLPVATLNQCLSLLGQEPVSGGNVFWIKTATGAVPWLGYDNDYGQLFGPDGMPIGSQDAAGGPSADDTADDDIGTDKPDEEQTGASNAGDNSNGDTTSDTPVNVETVSGDDGLEKRYRDIRHPGRAWNPSLMGGSR